MSATQMKHADHAATASANRITSSVAMASACAEPDLTGCASERDPDHFSVDF